MSYQYHGTTDLIALPNRTVQTYPSGLVRVERSFVCRKDQVAKYRNTIKVNEPMPFDDGAPAIDGLYIFPEPQEVVRDDGFVEFRVTAYGRTNTTGSIAQAKQLTSVGFFIYTAIPNVPGTLSTNTNIKSLISNSYTVKLVFTQNESINISEISKQLQPIVSNFDGSPFEKTNAYQLFPILSTGNYYLQDPITFEYTREAPVININPILAFEDFQSSGFGYFQEATISFISRPSIAQPYYAGIWYLRN